MRSGPGVIWTTVSLKRFFTPAFLVSAVRSMGFKPPWADTRSRFTLLMERMIRKCQMISGTCVLMRISCVEAFGVTQRAVMRRQQRKEASVVKYIGVDERRFARDIAT